MSIWMQLATGLTGLLWWLLALRFVCSRWADMTVAETWQALRHQPTPENQPQSQPGAILPFRDEWDAQFASAQSRRNFDAAVDNLLKLTGSDVHEIWRARCVVSGIAAYVTRDMADRSRAIDG